MRNILFISKEKVYSKVISIALKDSEFKLLFTDTADHIDKKIADSEIVIIDTNISESITEILKKVKSQTKPLIILEDLFEDTPDIGRFDATVIKKPFTDEVLIEEIEKITGVKIKTEETKMPEDKKQDINDDSDILELTDIVEESSNAVSDILSTQENKKKGLDEFDFDMEELDSMAPNNSKNSDENSIDNILKNEDIADLDKLDSSPVAKSEDIGQSKIDLPADDEFEILDTTPTPTAKTPPKKEQSITDMDDILNFKADNKDTDTPPEIEEHLESLNTSKSQDISPPKTSNYQESQKREDKREALVEDEIAIPIDKETIKLAKEIDQEDDDTRFIYEKKEKPSYKRVEKYNSNEELVKFSEVEHKLLEASQKIVEAIEQATIEIAQGIAKVTPKIIEEVSKEIIPKIAQKIISEEFNKKRD